MPKADPAKLAAAMSERRDTALEAGGFRTWLSIRAGHEGSEYKDLIRVVRDSKCQTAWDLKKWSECLELYLDPQTCEEAIALLIRAEAEWKVDKQAKEKARQQLEVGEQRKDTTLTHRNPEPVEAMKCAWKNRAGMPCKAPTVPGSDRCSMHGGAIIDPDTRRSMLVSAYATIVEGAVVAVDALVKIAESGRNELARVNAAKEILDRAGLTATLQVNVNHSLDATMTPTDALMARLDKMRSSLNSDVIDVTSAPAPALPVAAEREIVDVPSEAPVPVEGKAAHPSVGHAMRAAARRIAESAELQEEVLADVIQMPDPPPYTVPNRVPLR